MIGSLGQDRPVGDDVLDLDGETWPSGSERVEVTLGGSRLADAIRV